LLASKQVLLQIGVRIFCKTEFAPESASLRISPILSQIMGASSTRNITGFCGCFSYIAVGRFVHAKTLKSLFYLDPKWMLVNAERGRQSLALK